MNKVYIAFIDRGSYDSYVKEVNQIFLDKTTADDYASYINKQYAEKKTLIPIEDDFKNDEEYEISFNAWYKKTRESGEEPYHIIEFNKCIIEEFEVK